MSELTGALALAQLGKIENIVSHMRESKWRIRRALENIEGLGFRKVLDPEGDSGSFLISIYPNANTCKRFTEALRAEVRNFKWHSKG